MSCQSLDNSSGICFGHSNNITLLLQTFKDCCSLAPIVQYYDTSLGCSAYCPVMPDRRTGESLRHCIAEALGAGSGCFEPSDTPANSSVIARASTAAVQPVCSACVAAAATSTTGAAVRAYNADMGSWKTGLTIGVVIFTGMFAGGCLI